MRRYCPPRRPSGRALLELSYGKLWKHLNISLRRLLWGLLGGVTLGFLLGALLGASPRAERTISPTFAALAQVPTLAWIPLFMLLFGIGEALKLVVMVKAVVVPITIHTLVGVRDAQPRLRLWRPIIPATLPSFMAGLRLALTTGWASLLAKVFCVRRSAVNVRQRPARSHSGRDRRGDIH
ncbi:MAG: hypothetical protein WBN86_11560 [Porticoccaceae bacterium]